MNTLSQQTIDVSPVDALWSLIKSQSKSVRKALTKRLIEEDDEGVAQKALVKKSLTKAFEELHSGKVKHNARSIFSK